MGWRAAVRTLLVLAATATCVRLGMWQLSRLHEKHALHAAQRALLAEPAIELTQALPASTPGPRKASPEIPQNATATAPTPF